MRFICVYAKLTNSYVFHGAGHDAVSKSCRDTSNHKLVNAKQFAVWSANSSCEVALSEDTLHVFQHSELY